jgi:flagellar biosynthetic protein FlhB
MAEKPAGERTEQATPKRREEARKKGTVAKSVEVNGALTLLAAAMALPSAANAILQGAVQCWSRVGEIGRKGMDMSEAGQIGIEFLTQAGAGFMMLAGALMVVGFTASAAQVGFRASAEPLKPSFEKVNPLKGLQRLFGTRGLADGLKAILKLFIFALASWLVLRDKWDEIVGLAAMPTGEAMAWIGAAGQDLMMRLAMVWLAIAAADAFYQRWQTDKDLKMTKDEVRREMKEMEASPELRQKRMERARKIAKGGMAKAVRQADVLVTNPTHFAVAIRYDRSKMHAPMVTAKAVDLMALKMRELAKESKVPIVENRPLARALHAECEPGDFVPRSLFGPVAEVLAFVYRLKARRGAASAR